MSVDPWAFQRWAFEARTGSTTRKAVLMMLAGMADTNTGRCEAKQDTLATGVETTDRTVRTALRDLETAGFIDRRQQRRRDGSRRGDEFLLRAPWITEWPDGERLPEGSSACPPGSTTPDHPEDDDRSTRKPASAQERPQRTTTGTARKDSRADEPDAFPDDLPPEFEQPAIDAGKILKRTAITRQQGKPVTRAAVGRAVVSFPDRDHVVVARAVEAWLLDGNGRTKSCRDIVARFRQFLETSEPKAGPPLPGNVHPIGRGSRGAQPSIAEILAAAEG